MKNFRVSLQCIVFACVDVEAKDKVEAERIARAAHYLDFDIEKHTLTPESLESLEEIKE